MTFLYSNKESRIGNFSSFITTCVNLKFSKGIVKRSAPSWKEEGDCGCACKTRRHVAFLIFFLYYSHHGYPTYTTEQRTTSSRLRCCRRYRLEILCSIVFMECITLRIISSVRRLFFFCQIFCPLSNIYYIFKGFDSILCTPRQILRHHLRTILKKEYLKSPKTMGKIKPSSLCFQESLSSSWILLCSNLVFMHGAGAFLKTL